MITLLIPNTLGGLQSWAGASSQPLSMARAAANWIEVHKLQDEVWAGSRDFATAAVGAYLQRPIHYLECNCQRTFVDWNSRRHFEHDEFPQRVTAALEALGGSVLLLITNWDLEADGSLTSTRLRGDRLARFVGSAVEDESFFLYRITTRAPE